LKHKQEQLIYGNHRLSYWLL